MAGKATSLFDISSALANTIDVFSGVASRTEGVNDNDVQQVALVYGLGGLAAGTYFTQKKAKEVYPMVESEKISALGGFFPRF